MKTQAFLSALLVVGSSVLLSQPATAQDFSIFFDETTGSTNTPPTGAAGQLDFTFGQIDADSIALDIKIDNIGVPSRFMAFGFNGVGEGALVDLFMNPVNMPTGASFTGSGAFSNLLVENPAAAGLFGVAPTPSGDLNLGGNIGSVSLNDPFDVVISNKSDFSGTGSPNTALSETDAPETVSFTFDFMNAIDVNDIINAAIADFNDGSVVAAARFKAVGPDGEGSDKILGQLLVDDNGGDNGGDNGDDNGGDNGDDNGGDNGDDNGGDNGDDNGDDDDDDDNGDDDDDDDDEPVSVPEPASVLGLSALAAIFGLTRRRG